MIDTHCHLDLYPKPAEVIREVVRRRLYVIAVTTTPRAFEGNLRLIGNAPRIRVAVGLHPELVAKRSAEIPLACALVARSKYVGEVGLDGSPPHAASLGLQTEALKAILDSCRSCGGRVVSLHSRMAVGRVLDEIERCGPVGNPVLHWFSGTQKDLDRATELGCWFSVGPAMLASTKGRTLLRHMPIDRILPETDGPFAEAFGRSLVPWDAELALPEIARAFGLKDDEMPSLLGDNLRRLASNNVAEVQSTPYQSQRLGG